MSKAFLRHTFTKNIFDIVNHVYQILILIHFHYMTHNNDKQNNTTQKTKTISNTDPTKKNRGEQVVA